MSVTNLSQSPGTTGRATGGHSRTLTIDLWLEGQRVRDDRQIAHPEAIDL